MGYTVWYQIGNHKKHVQKVYLVFTRGVNIR